jgi:hypothetical protein
VAVKKNIFHAQCFVLIPIVVLFNESDQTKDKIYLIHHFKKSFVFFLSPTKKNAIQINSPTLWLEDWIHRDDKKQMLHK